MNIERFKDAPWLVDSEQNIEFIVGGAGGIGSWLVPLLVRAGFTGLVYDFDRIEELNLAGQLFFTDNIGQYKVSAVEKITHLLTGDLIMVENTPYTRESTISPYMFSAFDNMKARQDMFAAWRVQNEGIFIDGRLTAEQMQIFCVTPETADKYEKEYLPNDVDVPDAPCTFKQTSHAAAMIASHMVGFFTNYISNLKSEEKNRTVPFFWEYYIPINYLKTEV